jgi:hypothetical protein
VSQCSGVVSVMPLGRRTSTLQIAAESLLLAQFSPLTEKAAS